MRARRYNSAGTPISDELGVNVYTTNVQASAHVAADSAGNFVVVWQSNGQDGSDYGVFARKYNAAGNPVTGDVAINAYTTGGQRNPSVGADAFGNFVVTWRSDGDGSSYGIFARRFDNALAPLTGVFQVNTYTTSFQAYPAVAADARGDFVVMWHSQLGDGSYYGVFGQRFAPYLSSLTASTRATSRPGRRQRRTEAT